MKYKNVSEQVLTVPNAIEMLTVNPGDEILTAPKHAAPYVKTGALELVAAPKASSKSRRTVKPGEPDN